MALESAQRARTQFSNVLQDVIIKQNDQTFEHKATEPSSKELQQNKFQIIDIEGKGFSKSSDSSSKFEDSGCVVKLFDRLVDVERYDAKSSLYSICRDWMHESQKMPNCAKASENLQFMPKADSSIQIQKVPGVSKRTKFHPNEKQLRKHRLDRTLVQSQNIDFTVSKQEWMRTRATWHAMNAENEKKYRNTYNYLSSMFLSS
ncbi:uncharacterized protein LOC142342197 [Convolutriloba macropyga]|uniref:uncharacterized protein LOC142342197 n=1 Tax=Convolutriloba macropyga TaxID=536237 RepID=UPI003F51BEBE